MTNRFVFAILISCIAASLAACNSGAIQSSDPVAARASSTTLPRAEIYPNGEKRVGSYAWVWHTESLTTYRTLTAYCPPNYAVVGGGYHLDTHRAALINASRPNDDLNGWVVIVTATYRSRATVYASCAPVK
jgi:hypothetical protein